MAYLHCHTRGCGWGQDDWWSFKFGKYGYWKLPFCKKYGWAYNPFSLFLSYVFTKKGYWYPRRIKMDPEWAKDNKCRIDPHSWWMAWLQFKEIFWRFKRQKWWFYEDWKKDYDAGKAGCPRCGEKNFDID